MKSKCFLKSEEDKVTEKKYFLKPEKYGIKINKVSDAGNLICKKLSKKSLAALKADGYVVKRIPNGNYVICMK